MKYPPSPAGAARFHPRQDLSQKLSSQPRRGGTLNDGILYRPCRVSGPNYEFLFPGLTPWATGLTAA